MTAKPSVGALVPTEGTNPMGLERRPYAARYSRGTIPEKRVIRAQNFEHSELEDIGAKDVAFEDCAFSYSRFNRAYFREASFTNCKFIGCDFNRCNFRSARFSRCDFSYSKFWETYVDVRDIFNQLPPRPNVRRELAQALRRNAESVADSSAALECFWYEMKQAEQYLREAAEGHEEYYRKKYPGLYHRVLFRARLLVHQFSHAFWGHGESPALLLQSSIALLLAFSIALVIEAPAFGGPAFGSDPHGAVGYALKHTFLLMLGIAIDGFSPKSTVGTILFGAAAFTGFVVFGLFITTLTRRYVKR